MLTVLAHREELHDFKVIRRTERNTQGILVVGGLVVVHHRVNHQGGAEGTVLVGGTQSGVAVVLAFVTGGFLTVAVEGVLSVHLNTGEGRRDIGHSVVHTIAVSEHKVGLRSRAGPTRSKRGVLHLVIRTATGRQSADATKRQRAEVARDVEVRFTTEETTAVAELTVIFRETVFENEANLVAVAEVFRTLQAPTVAGRSTGLHVKGVDVVLGFHVLVGIVQARIDHAVERHVSSHRRGGKSAENGSSNKSLFHLETPKLRIRCRPASHARD